jgi:hypothetical protein
LKFNSIAAINELAFHLTVAQRVGYFLYYDMEQCHNTSSSFTIKINNKPLEQKFLLNLLALEKFN